MKLFYSTKKAFRPISEKAWEVTKYGGRLVDKGVRWAAPRALSVGGKIATKVKEGVVWAAPRAWSGIVEKSTAGYNWLAPRVRERVPLLFQTAKAKALSAYEWTVPQVKRLTPYAIDGMVRTYDGASKVVNSAVKMAKEYPYATIFAASTGLDLFVNLTVPNWERLGDALPAAISKALPYYDNVQYVFRSGNGLSKVAYAKEHWAIGLEAIREVNAKLPLGLEEYIPSLLEVVPDNESQRYINTLDIHDARSKFIFPLSYYKKVLAELPRERASRSRSPR